jgi:hypothetical protein
MPATTPFKRLGWRQLLLEGSDSYNFKPAQGGGVAGEGSGCELGRGDGQHRVGQGLVSGLDTGVRPRPN